MVNQSQEWYGEKPPILSSLIHEFLIKFPFKSSGFNSPVARRVSLWNRADGNFFGDMKENNANEKQQSAPQNKDVEGVTLAVVSEVQRVVLHARKVQCQI